MPVLPPPVAAWRSNRVVVVCLVQRVSASLTRVFPVSLPGAALLVGGGALSRWRHALRGVAGSCASWSL